MNVVRKQDIEVEKVVVYYIKYFDIIYIHISYVSFFQYEGCWWQKSLKYREHSDQEVSVDPSQFTDQFFEHPYSQIQMYFVNYEHTDVVIVHSETPIHDAEQHDIDVIYLIHQSL